MDQCPFGPPRGSEEAADLLTRAGFPVEHTETVTTRMGEDIRLDVETTSNRGDCNAHLGLAREVVALTDRQLKDPTQLAPADPVDSSEAGVSVENKAAEDCVVYHARIVRGVKVGPSPIGSPPTWKLAAMSHATTSLMPPTTCFTNLGILSTLSIWTNLKAERSTSGTPKRVKPCFHSALMPRRLNFQPRIWSSQMPPSPSHSLVSKVGPLPASTKTPPTSCWRRQPSPQVPFEDPAAGMALPVTLRTDLNVKSPTDRSLLPPNVSCS